MTEREANLLLSGMEPETKRRNAAILTLDSAGEYSTGKAPSSSVVTCRRPKRGIVQVTPASGVRAITFEFPLPLQGCSPNNSGGSSHWRVKEGARAEYRKECLALLPRWPAGYRAFFDAAVLRVEFWMAPASGRYHPRDAANGIAALKACIDAIVEANYLIDDAAKYLTWGETILHGAKESKGRACVVVTLTRMEAEK